MTEVRVTATVETLLSGILAMLIAEREGGDSEAADRRKTEVILRDAGVTPPDIALLMGKSADAVRKTIQRAK